MISSDIEHACATYGLRIVDDLNAIDDHWEFRAVNYKEAESTPKLYRADRVDGGGFRVRQIRKRSDV